MAQLPTEQAIGDLPDHLPRRMGVGGWQPGDLARGAQELARGGQQLGLDLGMLAGQEQSQDDQVAMAKANSLAAVGHVKIAQDLANETDPEKAALYPDKFQQNVDSAAEAAGLRPDMAAKFKINQAPEVARYQVGADTYTKGLLKNRAVAGFDTDADTAINTAIGTDDPTARQNILQGINGNLAGLVTKGYLTPEEARAKGQDLAHQYSTAHTAKLIGDAEGHYDQATGRWVPGDTSKLHEALEQFKFGPEAPGWNATVPGVPQDGASGEIDSPALRVKSYAPDLSAAAKQYGVSEDYLAKTAYIESQGNATADNGFAHGLMQFSDATAQQYGVNPKDARSSINGAAAYAADNAKTLTAALGRPPTDAELYIAHQQGPGAAKLLTNPNTPAGQLVNPKAISANGGDPNAPAKQFTDMWKAKYAATPSYVSSGTGAAPAAGAAGAPAPTGQIRAVGDSLGVGVGGVTGVSTALEGSNPHDVNDLLSGKSVTRMVTVTNPDGTKSQVKKTVPGLTDEDIKNSGPMVLSSGASNDPNSASLISAQLATLKGRNKDLSQVYVLGVGNRPDFGQTGVNGTLQAAAEKAGAHFIPLNPKMLQADGVHLTPQGYADVVAQIKGGAPAAAPAGTQTVAAPGGAPLPISNAAYVPGQSPNPFFPIPPVTATGANPHLVPPQSQWPEGATGVQHNEDGSIGYVMDDGRVVTPPGATANPGYGVGVPRKANGTGSGTIFDGLRPEQAGETYLKLREAANRIDRENEAQDKFQTETSVKAMEGKTADLIAGREIGPNEFASDQAAYADAKNPKVRNAFTTYALVRENLLSLLGKPGAPVTPQDVAAKISAQETALAQAREVSPNDPKVGQMEAVLKSSYSFLQKFQSDIKDRPLDRAAKTILPQGAVQPLDPNDQNLTQSLQRREAAVGIAQKAYGTTVPFFLEGEGAQFARGLARNPDALKNVSDPDVINRMADDAGFRTAIEAMSRSGDPGTISGAYKAMNLIEKTNPTDFDSRFAGVRGRLELWNNLLSNLPIQEAADRLKAMDDPSFESIKKTREQAADKLLTKMPEDAVQKTFATASWLNPLSWGSNPAPPASDIDTPMASAGAMKSDHDKFFREYYAMDPDQAKAEAYAQKGLANTWGQTNVGTAPIVMRSPPEKYYPGIGDAQSRAYLKKDLDDAIKKQVGDQGDTVIGEGGEIISEKTDAQKIATNEYEGRRILVADDQTAKEISSGQLPTYRVVIQDPKGNWDVLRTGQGGVIGPEARWPSADFRKRASVIGRQDVSDADRLPADVDAANAFKAQAAASQAETLRTRAKYTGVQRAESMMAPPRNVPYDKGASAGASLTDTGAQ